MCRLSCNLGASTTWNSQGLSRVVQALLYHFTCVYIYIYIYISWCCPKWGQRYPFRVLVSAVRRPLHPLQYQTPNLTVTRSKTPKSLNELQWRQCLGFMGQGNWVKTDLRSGITFSLHVSQSWRWLHEAFLKIWYLCRNLHGVTTQKTILIVVSALLTSNLAHKNVIV